MPRPARRRTLLVLSLWLAGGGLACASWFSDFSRAADGKLVHRERGYRVGVPGPYADADWTRVSVDGTSLSFRHRSAAPGGGAATLSMMVGCRRRALSPQLEARNLRVGLGPTRTIYAAPTAYLGYPGWIQGFEANSEDRRVHVESATLVIGRCTYDWLLVAPEASPALLDVFQDWWTSFEAGPQAGPEAGPGEGFAAPAAGTEAE